MHGAYDALYISSYCSNLRYLHLFLSSLVLFLYAFVLTCKYTCAPLQKQCSFEIPAARDYCDVGAAGQLVPEESNGLPCKSHIK